MMTAEVAVLVAPGTIVLEERPIPVPGLGQVLIEVSAVGVCGSDIHYFSDGRIGDFVVEAPLVLGHEAAGVVRGLGVGVRGLEVGQRVAMEPGIPCKRCRACRTGHYNLCPDVRFFATPPIDGTFARFVVHEEDFCYPLPDNLSDDAGALLEPLSVGVWAAWKARIAVGDRVLITGAGPIGLLAAAVARSTGAREVVVTDVREARLALALQMGATSVVAASGDELLEVADQVDVLLECSGSPDALEAGLRVLGPAARAVVVGMSPDPRVPVALALVQRQEVELTGTFRYANTYPTAMALASSGAIHLDDLVTGHYGLAQVAEALSVGRRDPLAVKPVVLPGRDTA
jgi:L-iditol 2-dehydrogenase